MVQQPNEYYPATTIMNVYELEGNRAFKYVDDWGNVFTKVTRDEILGLTWQGIPIINRFLGFNVHARSGSMPHQQPMFRPGYVEPPIQVPIHRPPVSDGMIRGLNQSLHMLNIGETLGP